MIKICYYRTKHRVTTEGHAIAAGEKTGDDEGRRLICASVTALVRTLAKNCVNAEHDKRMLDVKIELDAGKSDISAVSAKKLDGVVTLIFDTVCVGFDILAHQFPDIVAFQVL